MKIRLRYVERRDARGKTYWYWRRSGRLVRLPDDEAARILEASRLNEAEDAKKAGVARDGSVSWVVARYEASDAYRSKGASTKHSYGYILRDLLRLFRDLPWSAISRRVVVDFVNGYDSPSKKRHAGAVLSVLFWQAEYDGLAKSNLARKLRVPSQPKRDQVWSDGDIDRLLAHAGEKLTRWVTLLRYTAQRPGDALAMTWAQYDGEWIRLRQQKTGALVDVYRHRDLRAALDSWSGDIGLIVGGGYKSLSREFRAAREKAALEHMQLRDLRRTAMVRMAEAGAPLKDIAAVSGHSVDSTTAILETYIPSSRKMGRSAILKWEGERET